jgi:hypothetical protein
LRFAKYCDELEQLFRWEFRLKFGHYNLQSSITGGMMNGELDLRVDGRFATEEERARLLPILREKSVDGPRPVRHWTIEYVRQRHGDLRREAEIV